AADARIPAQETGTRNRIARPGAQARRACRRAASAGTEAASGTFRRGEGRSDARTCHVPAGGAMTLTCDVAVIGAGTAGLAAERAARDAGARTLLIDPAFSGTTCATVGCMPSKLLIAAADAAEAVRGAATFGIAAEPQVDGRAVMARVRRLRDGFAGGVRAQ